MKIAIVGQQDFGKAVLEAFLKRGDTVAAVFCAPEKEGARPDTLRVAAQEAGLRVHQFKSLRAPEAVAAMQAADADIGIMAFVLQFAPQEFVTIPKHGTIQFHPSLLPKYRGPSSINWPITRGETETGLTIFRPTDGLDEGAIILQKRTPVGENDTLGSVYFDRLFGMGVAAMQEAAALVVAGKHQELVQDETQASYEGWFREAEAKINWANHADVIHNLIRGCDPAPGAWTTCNGVKLQLFDSRKELVRTFGAVKGKIGEVTAAADGKLVITAQGGRIHVGKAKLGDAKKVAADAAGIPAGTILGG
ncbi:MAG: methionyl-tRNA formyltransferase [Betaproteobacteria bacterium]|nr:methionyl-tRNA formyltransferase [Betaproteobacteria bacterium]MBK9605894.1 methionyl-tRNA formyltransferase [Betaproteobacteria bacterium]